jgi:tetratricopeptide (TPR) repeat protein
MSEVVVEKDVIMTLQGFWEKNSKKILMVLGVVALAVGGWYAYGEFVKKPAEEKAADAMFKAEEYFAMDSCKLALNGDGSIKGFLNVMQNYSGTKAANLAQYYAGICYLKMGEYQQSVNKLNDFSTSSLPVQMVAYGALADAYSELNKKEDALTYYKKAATTNTNDEMGSAEYLWRAAQLLETMNKNSEAFEIYKEIKAKYPKAKQDIDKYIYKTGTPKNELSVQ